MNANQVEKYRRLLESIAARLRTDATGLVDRLLSSTGGAGGSELSHAPLHLGDLGTDEFLYDMNATLLANEQHIVAEIRAALQRLANGSFGTCETCAMPIAPARLKAIPYSRFCVHCAELNHDTPIANLDAGRPRSPKDTLAPEGEMSEDRIAHADSLEFPLASLRFGDTHAAGTAGGGTAVGGLAGSNEGCGDPVIAEILEATANSSFDLADDQPNDHTPLSGFTGGAVGGTPARKRAK